MALVDVELDDSGSQMDSKPISSLRRRPHSTVLDSRDKPGGPMTLALAVP